MVSNGSQYDVGLGKEYEYCDAGFAINPFVRNKDTQYFEGWHGWMGLDGSALLFNFEKEMTFSYVPQLFEGRPDRFRAQRLLRAVIAAEHAHQ